MKRIPYLVMIVFSCLIFSSCWKTRHMELYPETITVGSTGQPITFRTNINLHSMFVPRYTDDFKMPVESYEDGHKILTGDWFRLRMCSSNEIQLEIDENHGTDRQLTFMVYNYNSGYHQITAVITQRGAASLE